MDCYWRAGGRAFDTAHCYASWLPDGEGASERTVGAWLRERGCRSEAWIASKGGHPDLKSGEKRLHSERLRQECLESLERLDMDTMDCYWLHRDNTEYPAEEILGWCEELRAEGLFKTYACSNWRVDRIKEAQVAASERHWHGFSASSIGYALAEARSGFGEAHGMLYMDEGTWTYHQILGLPQMPYSSQAQGFFTSRYLAGWQTPVELRKGAVERAYFSSKNFEKLKNVESIAQKRGCSMNQVALAFLRQQPFPVYPIIGGRTESQIEDSMKAASVRLDSIEMESIF